MKHSFVVLFGLVLSLGTALPLSAVDLTLSIGGATGTTSSITTGLGRVVRADSSRVTQLNLGGNFANLGAAAIGWEIPVAFGGPGRADIITQPQRFFTRAEKTNFALTPGVRLQVLPVAPLTPWASVGVGFARLDSSAASFATPAGTSEVAAKSSTSLAVSVAGGLDWKPFRHFLLRGEIRNYNFASPAGLITGDPFGGNRKNNLVFSAGIGVRF
jgi:opacity protein-like surface antigen